MRELRELRAERLGIDGRPELEKLFRLTRPDKKKPRMPQQLPTAGVPVTPPPVKHAAPVAVQKAMTRYPRKVAP